MLASLIAQSVVRLLSAREHWCSLPVVVAGCCQTRQRAASCAVDVQLSCEKPSSRQHPACGWDEVPQGSQPSRLGQRGRECQTSHTSSKVANTKLRTKYFSRGDVTLCFQGLEFYFWWWSQNVLFLVLFSFIFPPHSPSDRKQSRHRLENFLDKVSVVYFWVRSETYACHSKVVVRSSLMSPILFGVFFFFFF